MKYFFQSFCVLILLPLASIAQDSTAVVHDSPAKALSVSEFTNQYKEDYLYIDRLIESIPTDEEIKKAAKEFGPRIEKLNQELEKVEQGVESADNISILKSYISRINALDKKLNTGTTRLIANEEKYNEATQTLNHKAKVWELTVNSQSKETTSRSFFKQIDKLQKELEQTKKTLNERRLRVMDISTDFTDMTLRISRIKEKTEHKKKELEVSILSKTQDDITNIKFSPGLLEQLKQAKIYLGNFSSETTSFIVDWYSEIFMWLIVCIFVLSLIVPSIIKKRKEPNPESEEMLIKHPLASLMLVVIAFAFLLIKDMPNILKDLVSVLAIIPILYLMRKYVSGGIYGMLILRTLFLIFLFICINIPQDYAVARLSMVLVIVAEVYMSFVMVRALNKSETINKRLRTPAVFISIVFGVMAVVAFIAAILGYVMIAERIMSTIYSNVYLAFALFILSQVFRVYVIGFLESKVCSNIKVLSHNRKAVVSRFQSLAYIVAVIIWSITFLNGIGVYNDVYGMLVGFLDKGFSMGDVSLTIGMILGFALAIYLTIVISSLIQQILAEDVLSRTKISGGMSYTISVLVKYSLLTIGFLIALRLIGIKFGDMAIILSAFGVGIGFGLQSIFSNLVSGLILLFERPIQKGDVVEVGALIGTVTTIGIRSSKVHTIDGAEVIVPNSNLITSEVVNWTLSDRKRRIEVIAGVSYSSNPHQVKELMMKVLETTDGILRYPEPLILFHEMADSSLNFRLLFWTDKYEEWVKIKSDVTFAVFDILGEHNIEIPFPQRDLHIRSGLDVLNASESNKVSITDKES